MTSPTPNPAAIAASLGIQLAESAQVAETDELRALAMELNKPQLTFSPASFRKGIVTAVNDTGTPPTLSLQLSGDTTQIISGVRRLEGYSPIVGQTVLVLKQGSEIMALGHIATEPESPWTKANLNNGFDHDGNNEGDLEYRLVIDHGSPKMQWRGGVNRNSGTTICNVPSGFRPSERRTLVAARNDNGMHTVKIDFETSGNVDLVGLQTAPNAFHDMNVSGGGSTDSTGSGSTGSAGDSHVHSHGGQVQSTSFVETHSHSIGNHTHFVGNGHTHGLSITLSTPSPNWISLNGLEYFL